MTTSAPHTKDPAWLLRITIAAAHAGPTDWEEQLRQLRAVSGYNPKTQTWSVLLGAVDVPELDTLQRLYEAAYTYRTRVHLEPVLVPASWRGSHFTGPETAAALSAQADADRPLGQLPRP
ncbi:hypothetical protein [Streptomyces sp. NPDC001820]|uniref:hypothetical protein n=1 Tax=Streptomyces sp. NPDC001820 TaxID=3364613 RepID=UPI0036AD7B52